MSVKDWTFRRRVRARMKKTGESYQAAHRNLSKSRILEAADQQPEKSLSPPQERPSTPRFAIHPKLAALGRTQPAIPTPEEQAARKAHLWTRLGRELARIASHREASRLLETIKKKSLDDEQLERLVRAFTTLPTGFMRQLELIAEQIRQLQPILEQAASLPNLARQAAEMWNLAASPQPTAAVEALRDLLPGLAAAQREIDELHTARRVPDEILAFAVPEILATARRLLDEVGAVPIHRLVEEDAVSSFLRDFATGPIAAAIQNVNEGPVAAAMRYIKKGSLPLTRSSTRDDVVTAAMRYFDNDAVTAAMRYFDNDAVAAAVRLFEDSPLASIRRRLNRGDESAGSIS